MDEEKNQTTQKVIPARHADASHASGEEEVAKTSEIQKPEEEAKEVVQLVVFELDQEEYAVDIAQIREILRKPEVTPIPNSPNFIEGIINVRGKIVVVIDMEKRFNLKRETEKKSLHILLTEIGNSTFGAIVDEVTEVLRTPKDSIEAAPAIISEKIHAGYVKGIVVLEDRLVILLDFEKVFAEKGLTELGKLMQKQAKAARLRRVKEKPKETKETEAEHKTKIEELVEKRIKSKKEDIGDEKGKSEDKEKTTGNQ